jgi:hypothetical protein
MSPREPELPFAVSYMPDQYAAPSGRTSPASQLAVELATEKKRLIDELRELQAKNDGLKSTTPVGTIDWYVKWVATFL